MGTCTGNVVFGAWFGRVLMKTGIASTLIRTTTELGGDKPAITCILLCIVTTACFSSIFGAGAVVAIGVIVLPIFMSLGIPKVLATCSFMLSVGAGMFVNPVLYGQYSAFFLGEDGKTLYPYEQHVSWGIYALLIQVAVVIIMVVVLSREKKSSQLGSYSAIFHKETSWRQCTGNRTDRSDYSGCTSDRA